MVADPGRKVLLSRSRPCTVLIAAPELLPTLKKRPVDPASELLAFADLPEQARRYVARLEEVSGVPVAVISTGSERDDTIFRHEIISRCKLPIAD